MKYANKDSVLPFLLGIGAAALGAKAVRSNCVRKATVNAMAKALILKDEAARAAQKVKEEAEDLYEEAKVQKRKESVAAMADEAEACTL